MTRLLATAIPRPSPLAVRSSGHYWRAEDTRFKLTWDGIETLTLDACMRPLAWSYGGKLYRRGLEGKTMEIEREADPRYKMHNSRLLTPPEEERILQQWGIRIARAQPQWTAEEWVAFVRRDEVRFRQIFRPVSILPPDQYRALVVQLTEGCPWNRCNFCDLYRDRPFRTKTLDELRAHVDAAVEYLGPALDWRRGLFLGDGNSGVLSTRRLAPILEWLRQRFPTGLKDVQGRPRHPLAFEQVSTFLDTFTGSLRSIEEWRELGQLGLQQIHLGVESGSPLILELLGKPSQPERVVDLVTRLKAAGIAVSVILMLGVGGCQGAAFHERDTLALLSQLPLDGQDRIYLSELLIHPQGDYARLAQQRGLEEMSRPQCRQQADRLRQGVNFAPYPKGPMVSLYDVRQFVYH